MAGSIRGITIEIEGKTSGLVKSLDAVNKNLKDTQKQLKTVNDALKLDPTNVELIAAKQEILATAIDQTKEKLALEKQAAEDAAKALKEGTITQNEYNALQAAVAKTTAELTNLEKEADGAGENLEEVADATEETGKAADDSAEKWEKFGSAVKLSAEVAAAAIAAVGAAVGATAKALVDCAVGGAEFSDNIKTLSSTTGVSTKTLQEWSYAAELVDVSVDTMTGALTKTISSMDKAADGNKTAIANFEKLGVSVFDSAGNLRDNEDVFWDVVDALGDVTNETERDALAMELLGKSAQELNPLIETGSEGMEEFAEQAHAAGYVLDDETLDAFGDFDDQLNKLDAGTTAAKNALGTILLPLLSDLAGEGVDLLSEFTNAVIDADGDISKIGEIVGQMIPKVVNVVMQYLPLILDLAGTLIESLALGLLDNLDLILTSAVEVIMKLCEGILEALPELIPTVISVITQIVDTLLDEENLKNIINAAVEIILAIAGGLSDALPQLIPSIVSAILTITTELTNHSDELIAAALDIIVALAEGLVLALPTLIEGIPDLIVAIIEAFGDLGVQLYENAKTWMADFGEGLVEGISGFIDDVADAASSIGDTIASYLHFSRPDKGALRDYETWMPDFMEGLSKGIDDNIYKLKASAGDVAMTLEAGVNATDYTGALDGISNTLTTMSNNGAQPIVVYIGDEKLGSVIARSNSRSAFISGGI